MNKLQEKIYEDKNLARELYYQSILEQETAILYKPIDQESFDNIIKRRNFGVKDNKYPNRIEYKREYKGYKIDITSCFGFTQYMINILRPDGQYIIGELSPPGFPSIYNRPFGMEYYDLIRAQEYIKFNLIELEKLDCKDFQIEKDDNWPCYFFNHKTGDLICMSKKMEDKLRPGDKIK